MAQEGWICPRCGKVNAPWVMLCFCNRNTQILPKVGAPYYEGDQATCNTAISKEKGIDYINRAKRQLSDDLLSVRFCEMAKNNIDKALKELED